MVFVLVGPAPPWGGGIASFTGSLAESLAGRGLARWISWRVPRLLPPTTYLEAEVSTERAERLLGVYDPLSWRAVGRKLTGIGGVLLTVSHPGLYLPYRELARGCRAAGGRVVLICHNVLPHETFPGQRSVARRLLGLSDAIVVHAAAEAAVARGLVGDRPRIVAAFHPAYDHGQSPWPRFPGHRRLLAFGHVRSYKGLPDLLDALVLLPDVSLDVVGRIEIGERRLLVRARRLGIADRVRFDDRYVPQHELRRVFAEADAVVVPYRQASQSGVVQLAYAYGRPVIATRVGGLAEAVVEGSTGALVDPHDPVDLAAGIARVLATRPACFAAGIRAVQRTRTWSAYADRVLEALA
jgi:glycosyltransferase involved in cell wall biosynthesis